MLQVLHSAHFSENTPEMGRIFFRNLFREKKKILYLVLVYVWTFRH
jgi:hypothetical protein